MISMDNPSFFLEGVVREKDELQDFEGPLSLIDQVITVKIVTT